MPPWVVAPNKFPFLSMTRPARTSQHKEAMTLSSQLPSGLGVTANTPPHPLDPPYSPVPYRLPPPSMVSPARGVPTSVVTAPDPVKLCKTLSLHCPFDC